MGRRSAAQTRQLLLDAAVAMLHEQGPAAGVLHIRLSDVVARVGLTTGAAYRLWDDQRDFHDELAVVALRWRDRSLWSRTQQAVAPVLASGGTLAEVLRTGSAANVQTLPDDAGILLILALRAAAHHHASLRRAVAERRDEAVTAFGHLYERVLGDYALRLREPFTIDHLCSAFTAVVEGFGVQTAAGEAHPIVRWAADGDEEERDWTLLGVCLLGVVDRMTEPDPGCGLLTAAPGAPATG